MKRKYETEYGAENLTTQEFEEQLETNMEATKREVVELIQTDVNFVQQVNVLALHLNLDSPTQCSDVIEYIISVIDKLVSWEEMITRP